METPLLMSNTFDIDRGVKGVLAPVLLRHHDFPAATLLQELIPRQDIHISSAAFLSARFPYVSPTGKFNENHHFTDGGTIENSGAETSGQLIKVFNEVKDSLIKLTKPIQYLNAYKSVYCPFLMTCRCLTLWRRQETCMRVLHQF